MALNPCVIWLVCLIVVMRGVGGGHLNALADDVRGEVLGQVIDLDVLLVLLVIATRVQNICIVLLFRAFVDFSELSESVQSSLSDALRIV